MATGKEDIIKDNRSGSNIVAAKAIEFLAEQFEQNSFSNTEDLVEHINKTGKDIIKSQPNLISLRKRVTAVIYYLKRLSKTEKSLEEIVESCRQKIKEINKKAEENQSKIAVLGAKLIFNNNKILTISSSSTVKNILLSAQKSKRKFEVFALESRPMCEGALFAEELAAKGIPVTLLTDASIGRCMPDMNMVLLGADRLIEDGFINKIGSLPVVIVAETYKVPVYMAAETEKILPELERAVRFYPHDKTEVYRSKNKNLNIDNYYFETIPYKYVSKIVCEEGIYETTEFINWYLKD